MNQPVNILFTAEAVTHTHHYGEFLFKVALNQETGQEHAVLVKGDISTSQPVLVRIASECMPGTVFDSADCECDDQLHLALSKIAEEQHGVFIYLRQEGRGQGLTTKIRALVNKNSGYDSYTAVEMLGHQPDVRSYQEAAEILRQLNISQVRLLTNNPAKIKELEDSGISVVEQVSTEIPPTPLTKKHLEAKKARGFLLQYV